MTQNEVIQIIAGCVGTAGFGILFHIRGMRLLVATLGGLLSWLLVAILNDWIANEAVNYFLVAFLIAIFAEIMARVLKTPTTAFITTSLVPLIPGASLYYTMEYVFESDMTGFLEKAVTTLQLASALALGTILARTMIKILLQRHQKL